MRLRLPRAIHEWPLSAKLIAALTCALFPLGVLATLMAARAYRHALAAGGEPPTQRWLAVLLPMAMWLAALAMGWLVTDRLLVQPLTRLRRAVERYGRGETSIRLASIDFLSHEVAEVADAFDRMADALGKHDRELEQALSEQKRLTREVHHRVKNNLQIVSSLLSIQARETSSPDVAYAYSTVQARVGALALVHRWMYDDETSQGVDLRALVTDLCASLEQSIAATEHIVARLRCSVERFVVGQDTAVPLAFLVTELANVAARRAAPGSVEIVISARASAGRATLTVASPSFAGGDGLGGADPASRIIHGMARQLRSPLNYEPAGSYRVEFAVPVTAGRDGLRPA